MSGHNPSFGPGPGPGTTTTTHSHLMRPRRSITSYSQGHYPTTTPASMTSSRSATGSRTAGQGSRRVKEEPNAYDISNDGEDELDGDDGREAEADAGAESKLEMRRERNRIKQRNLRSESALLAFITSHHPSTRRLIRGVTPYHPNSTP